MFDVSWLDGCGHLLTASGDKTVALWDVNRKEAGAIAVFKGHTATVKVVASAPDNDRKLAYRRSSIYQAFIFQIFLFLVHETVEFACGIRELNVAAMVLRK